MIETFKYTHELEKDSTCNNKHIDIVLQQARQLFGNILFVESDIIEDRGFFHTKRYNIYCLYMCCDREDIHNTHSIQIINLNNNGINLFYEEQHIVLYLKGICDGYQFTKLAK